MDFKNLDQLIDINLRLIANARNSELFIFDFKDINDNNLNHPEKLAKIMDEKNLITLEPTNEQRCDLTEFGHNINHMGGWITYQNEIAKREQAMKEWGQDKRIKDLTEENLILTNKQLRRKIWYSIIGFIAGAVLTNLKDIWLILNELFY